MSERRRKRVLVNHHLFTQTSVDSGSLTMLGMIIHRFPEPGEYLGVVERGRDRESFRLRVDESSPELQVNVDLAKLGGHDHDHGSDCGCEGRNKDARSPFVVNPGGYVVFHVSSGPGGYVVRVGKPDRPDTAVFDSTRLEPEDLFAVTLIRPGTYSVRNVEGAASGDIVVGYPKVGKEPHRPDQPVEVVCTESAFRPARLKLQAAQGQLYRFRTPSRIAIDLVEPDDGPRARPTKPRRPRR